MTPDSKTVVEWNYTPKNFFETELEIQYADGKITLQSGIARGIFGNSNYDRGIDFRNEADDFLRSHFLAQQVKTSKQFELRVGSLAREHSDGRRDVTASVATAVLTATAGRADIIIKNSQGEILRDTKSERIADQSQFRETVAELLPKDNLLRKLLSSYSAALSDKDNLLVHLEEIREALKTKFGTDKQVTQNLGVSMNRWRDFGSLANNEPVFEGRHRGKHPTLRKATSQETERALDFCRNLIEEYVRFTKQE